MKRTRLLGVTAILALLMTLTSCDLLTGLFGGGGTDPDFTVAASNGSVLVTLSNTSKVTAVKITRSTTSDGVYASVYAGSETTYTDSDVTVGSTYYYKVEVTLSDSTVKTLGPKSLTLTSGLAVPSSVTITPTYADWATYYVTLGFTAVTGATSYKVYYATDYQDDPTFFATDTNFVEVSLASPLTTNSLKIANGVASGQIAFEKSSRYYFFVKAQSAALTSTMSTAKVFTDTPGPAKSPTDVTIEAASGTSLKLTWSSSAGATAYQIYRSATELGSYSPVQNYTGAADTTTGKFSFTNTGLQTSGTYYYKVVGYNVTDGPSETEILQNTLGTISPVSANTSVAAPAGLVAVDGTTSVTLSWTAISGVSTYRVYRSYTDLYSGYTLLSSPSTNGYTDSSNLNAGMTYYYYVSAVDSAGTIESGASNKVQLTRTTTLKAPTSFAGTGQTDTRIRLSWTSPTALTTGDTFVYTVQRRDGATWVSTNVVNRNANSAMVTGLTAATSYTFRVYATEKDGTGTVVATSEYSSNLTAATMPANPTLTAGTLTATTAVLNWTVAAGASGYNIYKAATQTGDYSKVNASTITAATTSTTIDQLSAGNTYWFVITVLDSNNRESLVSELSDSALSVTTVSLSSPVFSATPTYSAGTGKISASWNAVSTATAYVVEYSINGGAYASAFTSGTSTTALTLSFTPSGAVTGDAVDVRIKAQKGTGASLQESGWTATTSSVEIL